MASIFLATAPYSLYERYGKLASIGATLPCLGLLMLGAVLRRAGHRVRIVDAAALGLRYDRVCRELLRFRPDIVGLTAVTPSITRTAEFASRIKRLCPAVPIVLGGPHVTAAPGQTLADYADFDYAVLGEGEQTAIALVEALSAGRSPADVPGVAYRDDGRTMGLAGRHKPIKDLDALPFPAWDLLDGFPDQYRPAVFKYKRLPSTHIVSARGCPNQCVFCDTSVFGRQIRFHSPAYVLEMMDYLITRFGIREVIFEDDQFLVNKQRVTDICDGLLSAKWKISWCCSGRVNVVKDLSVLRLMKRSGCWQISYGIESANQQILDNAKKAITIRQIEKAVRLTHKAGMLSKGFFIFGLPGETEKTMAETIRFAKSLPLNDISVFMVTPFPGSRLYDMVRDPDAGHMDYGEMNLLNPVYVPDGLSKATLKYYQQRFMKQFYLRPTVMGNYVIRLAANPFNLPDMIRAFSGFLRSVFDNGA